MKSSDKQARGHTRSTTVGSVAADHETAPRLPHERDESSDSQTNGPDRPVMRQAHDDLASGRVDTDRGPPMDETYQRQKSSTDLSGVEHPPAKHKRI